MKKKTKVFGIFARYVTAAVFILGWAVVGVALAIKSVGVNLGGGGNLHSNKCICGN